MKNNEKVTGKTKPQAELGRSFAEDAIDNIYNIRLNEEITALRNDFCKYYPTSNTETNEECYAIIFDNKFLHPIKTINSLAKIKIDHLIPIYHYAIVNLSSTKEEHLVVIVEKYNYENNLTNYLKKGEPFKPAQIEEMVGKITEVFSVLAREGIYCYSINPDNILMKDNKFYAIREFISSYPDFYQKDHYIAPEIAECHVAGRYFANNKSDIYALGLTMFEAYTATNIIENYKSIEEYNYARFENTTGKLLLARSRMPEKLRVFFKWTLQDEANIRWQLSNIKDWLEGKITKLAHESLSENKNTIAFNENHYSTAKSLAYSMFNNWNESAKFIRDTKLFKWASRESISNDNLDAIKTIVDTKNDTQFIVKNALNSQAKVAKILPLLDSNGPIRYDNIAFSALSIPSLIHYLIAQNKKEVADRIINLIREEAWEPYNKNYDSAGHLENNIAEQYKRNALLVQEGSSIKSIERFVYSLNPYICCNSIALKGKYVTTIQELLVCLDNIAEKKYVKLSVDRNIIAFVAAKLQLSEDIKPVILPNFPRFAEHPIIKILSLVNILQRYEPEINIPHLCESIAMELKELFQDCLYNIEFKKNIISQLEDVAQSGSISNIIRVASDQKKFLDDYNGYIKACNQTTLIEQKIRLISNEQNTFRTALLLGQKTTVLVSYVLCLLVTIVVIL
jgi:hypothetical protein